MPSGIIIFLCFLLFCIILVAFFWRLFFVKGISQEKKEFFRNEILRLQEKSSVECIIGYDKILALILAEYGYGGTLAEKLKKKPIFLQGNIERIWFLHKIRNKIVHEVHTINSHQLLRYSEEYKNIILSLL